MSNEKNLGWLFDIGDEILPSCMGIIYFINHERRIPIKQAVATTCLAAFHLRIRRLQGALAYIEISMFQGGCPMAKSK